MSTALLIFGGVFGYVFVAVVVARVAGATMLADGDEYAPFFLGGLWPVSVPTIAGAFAVMGMVWLAWNITEAPAALARRVSENRTLHQAERAKRLAEAREILKAEGLDYTP